MLLQPSRQDGPPLELQQALKPGWTAHLTHDERIYYCNHITKTSSWLPPAETWQKTCGSFPYGWEQATDSNGKPYFINHINKTTTYEDPRKDWCEEPPKPRDVELTRHPELGFGFVAGSEKPVIVRFVTEGGPSVDRLQPGDQILVINGEDVKRAPRDHVIQLVRSCKEKVRLTVCQPPLDNSARKSALLSAAKKAKLKSNPSRVRFAEGVVVNGSPLFPPSTFSLGDSSLPFMPNVLKVFLENGQTKSFKYDSTTLVQDVVQSLQQKLCIQSMEYFSLVVEHVKSLRRNKLTLLDPEEPLARIAARPGSHNLRCLFRVAFVPKDACELAQRDMVAFEYLYMQCCNDVVQERYAPELKYDIALRLAALNIHQHAISNNMMGKITVKAIEREFGLERFVPVSLMSTMKRKELRKLIGHFLKLNHNLSPSGQKSLTSLQAKLYYLNIISELPSYGAKCFSTNIRGASAPWPLNSLMRSTIRMIPNGLQDSNIERVILVSPKFGISQITGLRNSVPVPLADIEQMSLVIVRREDELSRVVRICFSSTEIKDLVLSMEDRDAEELVLVLQGYYTVLTGDVLLVQQDRDLSWVDDAAPSYHVQHQVLPAKWSYAVTDDNKPYANFAVLPAYQPPHAKSNGHLPSSDTLKSSRSQFGVDNNMNNMSGVLNMNGNATTKEHNGFSMDNGQQTAPESHKNAIDLQSVVSMELLETDVAYIEAKNEEVMRRVAEMQELVSSSEQYLTQQQQHQLRLMRERDREESDSECSHISSLDSDLPGQLKHSDSLLLLTQGQKLLTDAVNEAVGSIDLGEMEPSESDTDSMSTPTNSPSHRPSSGKDHTSVLKPSDSSFGLHSPDNLLPVGFRPSERNIQDLLKKLQEDSTLPYNFAEGTLYLDPDIIDLTMIPPPITPDEDGVYVLPPHLSMPPTPFADNSPVEGRFHGFDETDHYGGEQNNLLDNFLDLNLDLEAFLATVTVPPPTHQTAPSVELTPEEIMSFIIPPPPANGEDIASSNVTTRNNSACQNNKTQEPASSTKVIEYATVNRKGGPFSCCGKYRDSPEKAAAIQPPPRAGPDVAKPPARPPKTVDCPGVARGSVPGREEPPPSLPPRADGTPSLHGWLPPKKPPLPPGPSQEVIRKAQQSPVPMQKGHRVPVAGDSSSLPKSAVLRNGYVVSRSLNNREVLFAKSDITMVDLLERLDQAAAQCSQAQAAGGGWRMDEASYQIATASLTEEARQLVTASKLLVKSATSVAGLDLPENLANCLHRLRRLSDLASDLASFTTSPLQTRNLVIKVRDVAAAFRATLAAALPPAAATEDLLLAHAENLASVLATLLRSLRVFSP